MNVSLLAISVGNTRTQLGTFVEGKLVATAAIDNAQPQRFADALEQACEPLRPHDGAVAVLGSVNPPIADVIATELAKRLPDIRLQRADRDLPIPIGRQLDPESIVGDDRLLNAAAAFDVLKQACIIVDAGTAITIDFIDGAGTFHGGAIGPGGQMMLNALHEHTALLPEVELARPAEPLGHNTREAMLSAVYYGLRGMVRELVEEFAQATDGYPMVIATGGNAELLFQGYDLIDRIVPDLTLLGIAVTLQASLNADTAHDNERPGRIDDSDDEE